MPDLSLATNRAAAIASAGEVVVGKNDRRNHRLVCIGVAVWSAMFTVFYAMIGAPTVLVSIMAVCTIGGVYLTFAVAYGMKLPVATAWTTALMFIACATIPFYYGGVNFAGNAWLLVVPITASSMRSRRIALMTTIGLCVICAISLVLGEFGLLPEPLFSVRQRSWIALVNLMVIGVLLLVVRRMHCVRNRAHTTKMHSVNQLLVEEVEHRKKVQADLEQTRSELMEAARFAGRAEVATGALHNIGNALTSVSVSTSRAGSLLRQQRIGRVDDLARLLEKYDDPRLSAFAMVLAKDLRRTQAAVQAEMEAAVGGVEHVANVVAVQQEHARHGGLAELVTLEDEVHKAMVLVGLPGVHTVTVGGNGTAVVDRHRLLQILGNLMKNAKDAVSANNGAGRIVVTISVNIEARITVCDNGVGIDAQNIERVFAHGFSTKARGSGFGLHASALAAHEMSGSLNVQSDGLGCGATFALVFPLYPVDGRDSVCGEAC
jgi:signal transduction histidine kinase